MHVCQCIFMYAFLGDIPYKWNKLNKSPIKKCVLYIIAVLSAYEWQMTLGVACFRAPHRDAGAL